MAVKLDEMAGKFDEIAVKLDEMAVKLDGCPSTEPKFGHFLNISLQWGSKIRTGLDLEWLKRGWCSE